MIGLRIRAHMAYPIWRTNMSIKEAKIFAGQWVELEYSDRHGDSVYERAQVFEINFVPLYGPCLITDIGDISLDRVRSCHMAGQQIAA